MSAPPWFDRIAHDLRGPLTSLQTAAWLLKSDPRGANAQELADIVVRQSQRLARMIEELDDWSRAEQGRLLDVRRPVDLAALLDMALASVPDCRIEPEYAAGAEALSVDGDEARLAQLLRTLAAQAMARDPAPRMQVARTADAAVVTVADRGTALDDAQLSRLLQASQHPSPDEGLGLRLLTARAIAAAHGGTLEALPAPGGGLLLRCTLPLA